METMNNPAQEAISQEAVVYESKIDFNFNKLQAVACMALSAVVSISFIVWAVKSFV